MKRVGLIGPAERPELERLAIRLEERGGEAVFLDPGRGADLSVEPGGLRACGADLTGLAALYIADLRLRVAPAGDGSGADADAPGAALDRSRRELAGWNALFARFMADGGLVVNPPSAQALHGLKPMEMHRYAAMDLAVPRTVATTDPGTVLLETAAASPGRRGAWVVKGLVGGYSHTERLKPPAGPAEAGRLLEQGPLMMQDLIEGDNVRAFVVGGQVLGAAEIIPTNGAEIDSRRGEARIRRIELPPEASRQAAAAAQHWEMSFAAVDFMREDGSGRFLILECNSAPFFVAFEAATGIEVSGRLANLLLGVRRG